MANNDDIKRLNYFNGQLLDDNDFRAEQTYHIDMRRRLNQLLYSPGVVKGLNVKKNSDKTIIVSSGLAIDATGCEIITLADSLPIDVSGSNTSIYVTIRFGQILLAEDERSKDNIPGTIRWTERPIITASSDKAPAGASAGQDIILAKIKLDANGVIESFDTSERQLANVKIGNKVGIGTTDPGVYQMFVDGTTRLGAIKNYGSETILSIAPGTVQFDANAVQGGRLTIKGDTGNVGIGTPSPASKLTVVASVQAQEEDVTKNVANNGITIESTYVKDNYLPGLVWKTKENNETKPKAGIWLSEHEAGTKLYLGTSNDYGVGITNKALTIDQSGNVGIGTHSPGEKLEIKSGKLQLDGNQQIKFTDVDITNNLKLQLYTGYGLGINAGTLFYAANGNHSWRDNAGTNERMLLTTGTDGGLTVKGTGNSSFAGKLGIGTTDPGVYQMNVVGSTRLGGGKDYGTETLLSIAPGTVQFDAVNVSGGRLTIKGDTGNVGIGTPDPKSKLTVNSMIGNRNTFDFSDAQMTIFDSNHNGGASPNGQRDILHLVREGVVSQAYGNKASFALGRYENNGTKSRTQLDIKLTDDSFSTHNAILSLRSNGNVGIGVTSPNDKLDIEGNLRILTGSNPIRFTSAFSKFSDDKINQAEISNDIDKFKTLMIVGNKSNDNKTRRVSVWDRLEVNGSFVVAAGNEVLGVPIIDFQEKSIAFSNRTGDRYSENCVFTFTRPVIKAQAMLRSWSFHYKNREYVQHICIYCADVSWKDNTVTVPVVMGMKDATGAYDDPYGGDATIVVIAQLKQSL